MENKPLILVVDNIVTNLQTINSLLGENGYEVALAESGQKALELISSVKPDLILLDIMIPVMDGFNVIEKLKSDDETKDIPVIFLTSKNETSDIIKGFKAGGVDYITKPFETEILLARIRTHIDLKKSREELSRKSNEIMLINNELMNANQEKDKYLTMMRQELEIAAEYVTNLLPLPITKGDIKIFWKFVPTLQLGGDSFGYHWIDKDHLAIYLLDVCYHGIGSALLSISILNNLRFQNLRKTDFLQPKQVLTSLNELYQMNKHNDMYFSIWYGIFEKSTMKLTYTSAGHPPALLLNNEDEPQYLSTKNVFIGVVKKYNYKQNQITLRKNSNLYIFSDGAYEIKTKDGKRWTIEEFYQTFINIINDYKDSNLGLELEKIYFHTNQINYKDNLEDDFSILKISFD